jgi:transposase-like protein
MAIDKKLIDQLLSNYKKPEDIIGENGLLKELTKAILERALAAEMTDHPGYGSTIRRKFPRHNSQSVLASEPLCCLEPPGLRAYFRSGWG